jgi:hypothetical protein
VEERKGGRGGGAQGCDIDGEREGKNELDRAAGWDKIRQMPGEGGVTVRVFVMLSIYFVSVKYMFVKCKACVCLCETFENLKVQVKRVFL